MIVHEDRCGDVHRADQDKTLPHLALLDDLHNLVCNINDLLTPLRVEPEVLSVGFHEIS